MLLYRMLIGALQLDVVPGSRSRLQANHALKQDRAEERFKGMFSAPNEDPQDAPSRCSSTVSRLSSNSAPTGTIDHQPGITAAQQVASMNVSVV